MTQGALRGECQVDSRTLRQLAERAGQAIYAVSKRDEQGKTSIYGSKSIVSDG
jgi:hypothetical protein